MSKDSKEIVQKVLDSLPEDIKSKFDTNTIEKVTENLDKLTGLIDKFTKELGKFLIEAGMHKTSPDVAVGMVKDVIGTVGSGALRMLAEELEEDLSIHLAANKDPKFTGN